MAENEFIASATDREVKIAGVKDTELATSLYDVYVESDLDQPDMATLTLENRPKMKWSEKLEIGASVEISLGFTALKKDKKTKRVFKGEIVGIEPIYDVDKPTRVVVRAFDPLHKLTRGKKTTAFANVQDADIVKQIAKDNSLKVDFGDEEPSGDKYPKHPHVYQHNQTDLKFLRLRAARIGFRVYVEDDKLFFIKKKADDEITLNRTAKGSYLQRFCPRLSMATQVKKVEVRAWDAEKKEVILGAAPTGNNDKTGFGDRSGASLVKGDLTLVETGVPVLDKPEAKALAEAIMSERMLSFITGDGVCFGNPELYAGSIVTISWADPGDYGKDGRFDGKYLISSVRHRAPHDGPFRTDFRFCRDAHSDPGNDASSGDSDGQMA